MKIKWIKRAMIVLCLIVMVVQQLTIYEWKQTTRETVKVTMDCTKLAVTQRKLIEDYRRLIEDIREQKLKGGI